MDSIRKIGPGLLLCLAIALPSWLLGHFFPVVGGPVFAILIGMLLALVLRDKSPYQSGIAFTSKKILQYAVILLGFGLNLSEIAKVGAQSLPIICSTISISLIIAFLIRKGLHMPNNISVLVGVGSSICGGSAIAATAPVIGADDEEIAQSISVIFLFNILAALLFPTLGALLGMTNEGFGLFAGTAINDTSSVTAAASTWDTLHNTNGAVLEYATIVKLTRTLAIIPITLALAFWRTWQVKRGGAVSNGSFDLKKFFPFFNPLLRPGLHHHHRRHHGRRGSSSLPALQGTLQVLYHPGHGGHRAQHRPGEAGENRRKAHLYGHLLLGRHHRCQPADAAHAGPLLMV